MGQSKSNRSLLNTTLRSFRPADEPTITVGVDQLHAYLLALRDHPAAAFEQLVDLCGVDYLDFGREGESPWQGARYAVVYHLLSVSRNDRLRVITWLNDDDLKVPVGDQYLALG